MTPEGLDYWADDFEAFCARFAHLFTRSEPRAQAAKYMRGLMAEVDRKNGWQIAEAIGDQTPDRTQRLLYRAHWDVDVARDVLQQFIIEAFGDEDGIGVGSAPATAAAIAVLHELGAPIDEGWGEWLLSRCYDKGGFRATPAAPIHSWRITPPGRWPAFLTSPYRSDAGYARLRAARRASASGRGPALTSSS